MNIVFISWTPKKILEVQRGPETSVSEPLIYYLHGIAPKGGKKNRKNFDMVTYLQKVFNEVKPYATLFL